MKKKIVVGMSGGVDSSVVALLLKQQGHDVTGLFMRNWNEQDEQGVCPAEADYQDVISVCEKIGIPYYALDLSQEYWDRVFAHFVEDYKKGLTPNPDILCNREIKFDALLEKALSLGADYLATGHYARIEQKDDHFFLGKGKDHNKDQSYFLYTLKENVLSKALFPLGDLDKKDVRALAEKYGLATSKKKDSTGICFIGERHFRTFLQGYIPAQPGELQTLAGKVVGQHQGSAFYTHGQRKGLGIGGLAGHTPNPKHGDPAWYVVAKDSEQNIVYVEQGSEHPALFTQELWVESFSWVSGQAPDKKQLQAKHRYRQADQLCILEGHHVRFEKPQRAITCGQSVVLYDQDRLLGGGVISKIGPTFYEQGKSL